MIKKGILIAVILTVITSITVLATPLAPPTNFQAIPSGTTTIDLSWVATPSSTTLVRWKLGTFPSNVTGTDGSTVVYAGSSQTYTLTGLTNSTTYYFSAWSYNPSGGDYSTTYVTDMATTLIQTSGIGSPTVVSNKPSDVSFWTRAGNGTAIAAIPFFFPLIEAGLNVYHIPSATGWTILGILLAMAAGILIFTKYPEITQGNAEGQLSASLITSTATIIILSLIGFIMPGLGAVIAIILIGLSYLFR